ncbi:alkaline ceramidase 3-like [Macrosteles quadrilineatus]|uniref:alkaline ceramidase 3-like n=1 Tax=Macrosteles quadrilineatus TaxID=74068 RepID=UPI0023E0EB87|nr:alkaline ceramidase 3-like [Macrosteles quadrilineatus]XP_054269516.1 alkaline ceramidase 3-like [Macrosteles quadrilineatus]XP_054269517.1 alkaline ceramidase 3-like [Macrosteles quadrilineatus]XP_054269518.1 alkaline ceramidase 3-like [Macrosteles quadrilineatus]XP_054269519.1 alkaline ceramidase 3-like [Macrosteles quadrilineatus]XP_054269520.1 alkaline ceramidase 3-like [Macrosteles quadrilineatus]
MAPTSNIIGYWGKQTATIDWCERNYEVSFYVAEWWNTISNLMIILPPLWGIVEVFNQGFEKRFIICNFLVFIVGVGSWCFHMTLLYEMQLFDELPMIYGSLFLLYCVYEAPKPYNKHFFSNIPLFTFLFGFAILFTVMYLWWPQPLFQHASYGVIILWSWIKETQIVRQKKCKTCKRILIMSVAMFCFAFFIWNIDKALCSTLDNFRGRVPSGVGALTQLHAWWHGFAGYASYLQIFFCIHAWYDFHKRKGEKRLLNTTHVGFSLRWS